MLVLKNIVKDYTLGQKDSVRALKDISVAFEKSGFVSILGQSGCGKTTLLNIIGGLDKYTSGDLLIDGISTKDYKDKDWDLYRNNKIGFVFQNYNLIPHLSILENVMIPLSLNGENATSRKEKAIKALEQVGLKENFKKKPNQLSGGQAQRVAIARALVNDPEIILADEPTGALDSQTSVLVMEILKEISKTKLVIMVTHNQILANEYSTRIITMKDGEITGDSNNPNIVNESSDNKIEGKTSMGFLTAIKMALKNIFTKKGRVAMISVASSFGVIGVGLVLALSNGFEGYIQRVEESTANNAPITISNRSINYKINENLEEYEQFPTNEEVNIYDASQNQLLVETIHTNKLDKQFLKYIDDIDKTEKYKGTLSSYLINYTLPQYAIVSKSIEEDKYTFFDSNTKVNSTLASLTGFASLPNTIFHELYGDQEYIEKTYDVIKGQYPKNDMYTDENGNKTFDIVLIVDKYNRIDKSTLVSLGLINEESKIKTISFDDILETELKFYKNDEIYYFNEENPDDLYDTAVYRDFPTQNLTVYDENGNELSTKLPFPKHRGVQYVDYSKDQGMLKDLYNGNFSFKKNGSDHTADDITLKISGILRVNKTAFSDFMPMSLAYTNGFKTYANDKNKNSNISKFIDKNIMVLEDGFQSLQNYIRDLSSEESTVDPTEIISKFNRAFATFLPFTTINRNADNKFEGNYSTSYYVGGYGTSLKKIYGYGGNIELDPELKDILSKEEIDQGELVSYFVTHYDQVIPTINYMAAELNTATLIESVILFASSLSNKDLVKEYLDNYNIGKETADTIQYSDIIGSLTDGLGQMIDIISIVLIVFASISLVVSCVMTGIITYNSVLERIKEIGVLRAVGARKKDVGRLFKSESTIIGVFSGLLGVIATYLMSIPINLILNSVFPDYNIGSIANLDVFAAIILVIISGALAFVSGIIPARNAARKDPVIALRSE